MSEGDLLQLWAGRACAVVPHVSKQKKHDCILQTKVIKDGCCVSHRLRVNTAHSRGFPSDRLFLTEGVHAVRQGRTYGYAYLQQYMPVAPPPPPRPLPMTQPRST